MIVRSMDVTASLNSMIRDMSGEWMWFQADDHNFASSTLTRLLDREVDVVVPLMCKKSPPFGMVIYSDEIVQTVHGREYPGYNEIGVEDIPPKGLLEVHAAGSGSMLVRKHVLDAVGDPWFESSQGQITNDDLEFCRKIREAGFKIYVDTEVMVGHIGQFTVYPLHRNGHWGLTFDFGGVGRNRIWLSKEAISSFDAGKMDPDDPALG
jgi:GT2 family glycosyltransferase